MKALYINTQKPGWIKAVFVGYSLIGFTLIIFDLLVAIGLILIIIGALLYLLFNGLTVSVSQKSIIIKFGYGLIKKRIKREDVNHVKIVRNKAIYGWGIRLTPHGWLWNIHGLDAIELSLKNGKSFRIGTNQPKLLLDALSNK